MKYLLKLMSLSILCVYFSFSAQAHPTLFGVWSLNEVTLNSDPKLGLAPFPAEITIEAIEDKGKVTLHLCTQSKTKSYPFSKTEVIEQKNAQVYDKAAEFPPYTLEEKAVISISDSDDVLEINLEWAQKNENDEIEWTTPGSYTFTLNKLNDRVLIFSRTNDEDVPEEGRVQTNFEAHYRKVGYWRDIWTGNDIERGRKLTPCEKREVAEWLKQGKRARALKKLIEKAEANSL